MKRIDINAYFGHWPYWDLPRKTPAELVELMDRHGIDQAVVTSLRGVFISWREGNGETFAAAGAYPDRLLPAVSLSPFQGGDGAALRAAIEEGARMLRLFPAFHSYSLGDGFVDEICAVAGEHKVPVMIPTRLMMNWRFQPLAIEAIGEVARRHPRTDLIISGPNYLVEFQAVVRVMRDCPQVAYEISCLQGFDAVARLVGLVGAHRVLFGTGAVLNNPACNVAKLDHARVDDGTRRALSFENAQRLLGI